MSSGLIVIVEPACAISIVLKTMYERKSESSWIFWPLSCVSPTINSQIAGCERKKRSNSSTICSSVYSLTSEQACSTNSSSIIGPQLWHRARSLTRTNSGFGMLAGPNNRTPFRRMARLFEFQADEVFHNGMAGDGAAEGFPAILESDTL